MGVVFRWLTLDGVSAFRLGRVRKVDANLVHGVIRGDAILSLECRKLIGAMLGPERRARRLRAGGRP
jgi:hypothetical protein